MSPRRRRNAATPARETTELAAAVPIVVAHRVARMALAGPNPNVRDHREFARMSAEKVAAFSEAWVAMWDQSLRIQQEVALAAWRWWWSFWPTIRHWPALSKRDAPSAALRVLAKGLAPMHRRATANARRLGRARVR
jgi:hypothetical protein